MYFAFLIDTSFLFFSKKFLGQTKIIEKIRLGYDPKKTIFAYILLFLVIVPLLICGIKDGIYMPFLFWKVNVCHLFGVLLIWMLIEMLILYIKTKLKSIKITDKLIDENFTLTSTNKDLTKTFINKDFFEKLFKLRKTYRTKSIRCAFFEDNIIIMIGTPKDLFEFGTLFKSAYATESYKTYFEEIVPVFEFIHYLKNASPLKEYLN